MLRSALLPCLLTALVGSGCVAVAAAGVVGVGLVQYNGNEAAQDFPTSLQETWEATLEGLKHIDIEPEVSELGPSEGRIQYKDMVVLVERHPEGFTRVRVRVGAFYSADHERRSQIVLQEIGAAVGRMDDLKAWSEKVQGLSKPPEAPPAPAPASPKPKQ